MVLNLFGTTDWSSGEKKIILGLARCGGSYHQPGEAQMTLTGGSALWPGSDHPATKGGVFPAKMLCCQPGMFMLCPAGDRVLYSGSLPLVAWRKGSPARPPWLKTEVATQRGEQSTMKAENSRRRNSSL